MEVSITQFRRHLFDLVGQAMDGAEVWVTHKGRRFRIAPEKPLASRLDRITPMEIVHSGGPALDDPAWKDEMRRAWESDWDDL